MINPNAEENLQQGPKFEEKVIVMRRVAAKRTGGNKMRFSVLAAVGDKNGTLGIALAKARENVSAVKKAKDRAKKYLFTVTVTKDGSIPFDVSAKYGASKVYLKPAPLGAGLIAGSSVRQILELAGYSNVSAKIIDGSNKINNVYAVLEALKKLKDRI
jgi:small subunit ribosomal protein S5